QHTQARVEFVVQFPQPYRSAVCDRVTRHVGRSVACVSRMPRSASARTDASVISARNMREAVRC
ncbi:MAG: hypothetical protein QOD29_4427, partial [Alphaproteobacteria bacterium]|nr:hypothetical protein [Alphaproteobacteria bacterium]